MPVAADRGTGSAGRQRLPSASSSRSIRSSVDSTSANRSGPAGAAAVAGRRGGPIRRAAGGVGRRAPLGSRRAAARSRRRTVSPARANLVAQRHDAQSAASTPCTSPLSASSSSSRSGRASTRASSRSASAVNPAAARLLRLGLQPGRGAARLRVAVDPVSQPLDPVEHGRDAVRAQRGLAARSARVRAPVGRRRAGPGQQQSGRGGQHRQPAPPSRRMVHDLLLVSSCPACSAGLVRRRWGPSICRSFEKCSGSVKPVENRSSSHRRAHGVVGRVAALAHL